MQRCYFLTFRRVEDLVGMTQKHIIKILLWHQTFFQGSVRMIWLVLENSKEKAKD